MLYGDENVLFFSDVELETFDRVLQFVTKFKVNGDGECTAHEEGDAILLWVVKGSVCAVDVWFPVSTNLAVGRDRPCCSRMNEPPRFFGPGS